MLECKAGINFNRVVKVIYVYIIFQVSEDSEPGHRGAGLPPHAHTHPVNCQDNLTVNCQDNQLLYA